MEREREAEVRLCDGVRKLGGVAFKFTSPGNAGVPDRMIVMPGGRIIFVEVKREGGKPTVRQLAQLRRLRELGCQVFLLVGVAAVDDFLKSLGGGAA